MSAAEEDRLKRKLAIEAMTAEMMTSEPMSHFKAHIVDDTEESQPEDDDVGPPIPPSVSTLNPSTSVYQPAAKSVPVLSSSSTMDVDDIAFSKKIPISHQVDLTGHTKAVTCLSIDPAGNRVVTGSLDYNVKLYDFGGMDNRFRPFNSIEPTGGHPVVSISHSPSGDKYVLGLGSSQPKVYDRDGVDIITFVRGDMYIRDMTNTKGHTMEVTGVYWHPTNKDIILSSSLDGTLRIWDLTGEAAFGNLVNKHVLKIRSLIAAAAGLTRIGGTSCTISPNGKYYIGGATDGSIHIWYEKKIYSRADVVIKSAHGVGSSNSFVTCVLVTSDNLNLISRGDDGSIKVWDLKRTQSPIKVFSGYPNIYQTANMAISPDNTLLVCGISSPTDLKKERKTSNELRLSSNKPPASTDAEDAKPSSLCFFDLTKPTTIHFLQIGVTGADSTIFVKWMSSTNQIFCTTSSGFVRTYFDPRISKKGAMLSSARPPKRQKDPSDFAVVGEIYNPDALPMFKNDPKLEHKRLREQKDARVPERPPESASKINTSFFFTQYVTGGKAAKRSLREEDPREALLKIDEAAKSDPFYTGRAYNQTQPKPVLAQMTFEEEQEEFKKRQKQL